MAKNPSRWKNASKPPKYRYNYLIVQYADERTPSMKPIATTLRKLAAMKPPEFRERGRQTLLKYGERLLGFDQSEMGDRAFRRHLLPSFERMSLDSILAQILGLMRGSDFSRRPFMPLFGSREFTASSFSATIWVSSAQASKLYVPRTVLLWSIRCSVAGDVSLATSAWTARTSIRLSPLPFTVSCER